MKTYYNFSFDDESGEGSLTPGTKELLEEYAKTEPLFAADGLKDVIFELTEIYNEAVRGIARERVANHEP